MKECPSFFSRASRTQQRGQRGQESHPQCQLLHPPHLQSQPPGGRRRPQDQPQRLHRFSELCGGGGDVFLLSRRHAEEEVLVIAGWRRRGSGQLG